MTDQRLSEIADRLTSLDGTTPCGATFDQCASLTPYAGPLARIIAELEQRCESMDECFAAHADAVTRLREENVELRERIAKLEEAATNPIRVANVPIEPVVEAGESQQAPRLSVSDVVELTRALKS